jgi:hypothetical protein
MTNVATDSISLAMLLHVFGRLCPFQEPSSCAFAVVDSFLSHASSTLTPKLQRFHLSYFKGFTPKWSFWLQVELRNRLLVALPPLLACSPLRLSPPHLYKVLWSMTHFE